jgi:PAS domain S-box-containing protein
MDAARERALRHARILAMAARSLALNVTPRAMYADIGRLARTALGASGIAVYLADCLSERIELPFCEGAGAEVTPYIVGVFWDTLGGRVVRTGIAEFRRDTREFPHESVQDSLRPYGIESVALLPLVVEGRPRGLLSLRFTARQPFDEEQRQLLQDFATHVALALRNALLFADLERRAARLAAVASVQQAISASTTAEEVYAEIYKAVASVVDAPCFALYSWDPAAATLVREYVVHNGLSVSTAGMPPVPLGGGATSQTFRTGTPSIAARSGAGWSGTIHGVPGAADTASVLSVPVVHGDETLGVMQAESYRHDAYDWSDVDLVTLIARQAGTAITNARLFEAERTEREEAAAAARVARAALRDDGLAEGAEELVGVLRSVLPCEGAALAVLDQATGRLRWIAANGSAAHLLDAAEAAGPGAPPGAVLPWEGAGEDGHIVMLSAGSRQIGAIAVRLATAPRGARLTTLQRLADPVALALDALLLRDEERRRLDRLRMLATAIETIDLPMLVATPDGIIRYANGAASRVYGYATGEIIGMHAAQLNAVGELAAGIERVGIDGGSWSGERVHRRKDGTEFPAYVSLTAVHTEGGRVKWVVGSTRDLTEERRVAEQLRQSEKLAALGELVAGVAHEVNNPLTGISAFAQLLQEEALTEEQLEAVRLIKREADRAVGVIRDLLAFARKTGPRVVLVDLNALAEQTIRLRAYGLRTAGVTVQTALAPDLQPVRGDDRQLQQVLLNLIVNAEHAMTGRGRRTLTVRSRNVVDRVVLEVSDTGVGIPREAQRRIFEPFFTTKPEGAGTGLGLSVSYGIIQAHGGSLSVESELAAGATFRITLPAARAVESPAVLAASDVVR